jgi:DNA-binding Lrp family transcriptional regulator/YHS domain-containing protein
MELDPVDIKILELLQENGRLSFRDLAKRTGVTTPTVSSKVEHLENMGLIEGYTVVINPEMLDQLTILLDIECKPSDLKAVLDRMEGEKEVRELYAVDGTRVHAKVTLRDQNHLNGFLETLGSIEEITSYKYHTVTRTVKEASRAVLHDGQNVVVNCYYCGKPIYDNPVKLKLDGKDHYLCCQSCARLFKEKYERIKAEAD